MSLAGRGVVVTRPRELAESLARLLESRGARAVLFPAIEIEPLPAPAVLMRLAEFDLVAFASPSAVRVALAAKSPWPPRLAAAIGEGTRRELERAGARAVLAPEVGADSEALLALPRMREVRGERILIVRGAGGRALLGEALAARGALVEYAECYRRARPKADAAALVQAWRRGEIDALAVSSAEALDNLLDMGAAPLLGAVPVFVPHERIARHASARGAREAVLAGPGEHQMIERLVAYFHERT
jgi:uroporphyrinogen-III synthase